MFEKFGQVSQIDRVWNEGLRRNAGIDRKWANRADQ